jgi:hypothetical protein
MSIQRADEIHIYDVIKGLIYRKFPMGGFSTWLHYLFAKIFVYCIIIVQIANKVRNKKNIYHIDGDYHAYCGLLGYDTV